jgi:hypothetical protein
MKNYTKYSTIWKVRIPIFRSSLSSVPMRFLSKYFLYLVHNLAEVHTPVCTFLYCLSTSLFVHCYILLCGMSRALTFRRLTSTIVDVTARLTSKIAFHIFIQQI